MGEKDLALAGERSPQPFCGELSGIVDSENENPDKKIASAGKPPRDLYQLLEGSRLSMNRQLAAQDAQGGLSFADICKDARSPARTGEDALALALLYQMQHGRVGAAIHSSQEAPKLTVGEVKELSDNLHHVAKIGLTRKVLVERNNWNGVNGDDDADYLNKQEIETKLKEANLDPAVRESLEYLRDNVHWLQEQSNDEWFSEDDGVTKNDVTEWYTKTHSKPYVPAVLQLAERANLVVNRRNYDLYKGADGKVSLESVRQGSLGNCYLEATIASLAAADPDRVKSMIAKTADGKFAVKFGACEKPILVDPPSESEMILFNRPIDDGIWASVFEKAFSEHRRGTIKQELSSVLEAPGGTELRKYVDSGMVQALTDGGGQPHEVMKVLTGKEAQMVVATSMLAGVPAEEVERSRQEMNFAVANSSQIQAAIEKALSEKQMVAYGTRRDQDTLVGGHAYSITKVERSTEADPWVTIRNPWGTDPKSNDGYVRIRMSNLVKHGFFFFESPINS